MLRRMALRRELCCGSRLERGGRKRTFSGYTVEVSFVNQTTDSETSVRRY